MPTFSMIVPVYNAEKTLRKCLDSLRLQTYKDFEVHMIENGSKDTSRAICQEYAEMDPRFWLHVSEKNCGPSGARNIGLEHVKGTYVTFLDSDDYVESDYFEVLHRAFENADAVFFGYHQRSVNGDFICEHIPGVPADCGYYETLVHLFKQDMFGYTWIKAFRRDTIGEHRFSPQLNLLEDEVFACEILRVPCRIAVVPKAIHNYITGNAGSLIGRTHPDYCCKVDAAYKAWKALLAPYEKKYTVLEQMANAHVERCMYYGYEHDVNAKAFFALLAESEFFADATVDNEFTSCLRACSFKKISCMRIIYRLKNKVAKLLKR